MAGGLTPIPGEPRWVRSGLYVKSENGIRIRDRRVQRLVKKMRAALPWLDVSDVPTARACAQFEILADRASADHN